MRECENSFFYKTRGFGDSLATETSHEFQSPNNWLIRLYFLSYSAPVVMTLHLTACFTHVTLLASHLSRVASCESLASSSRNKLFDCIRLIKSLLSHAQPLHNFHLNTGFLIAKLQANLAQNKANKWLNKFNLTISPFTYFVTKP